MGPDIFFRGYMSKTVQLLAIFSLFLVSVSFAQSNIKEDTPLIKAIKADNKKEVKRILKSGVDVNELGQDYKTALDVAVEHGHVDIAISLIKHKAKVTSEDNQKYVKSLIKSKVIQLKAIRDLIVFFGVPVLFSITFGFIVLFELTLGCGGGWIGMPFGFLVGVVMYISSISILIPIRINHWKDEFEKNWMLPV